MSGKTNTDKQPETADQVDETAPDATADEGVAQAEAAPEQAPAAEEGGEEAAAVDPLEQLTAENADLHDRLLRAVAETENIRRRSEREKAEATLYAASNFARDILSVADNLSRALEAVPEDKRKAADETTRTMIDGIELTQRELLNVFERHGIKPIEAQGAKFDPNQHQAMFKVPDPAAEPGTVVQVVQTGYGMGERVLRPAMVGVATAAEPDSGK